MNRFVNSKDAAAILGISPEALSKLEQGGCDIPYIIKHANGPIEYSVKDLNVYMRKNTREDVPVRACMEGADTVAGLPLYLDALKNIIEVFQGMEVGAKVATEPAYGQQPNNISDTTAGRRHTVSPAYLDPIKEQMGETFRYFREHSKLNVKQAARMLGVTDGYVNKIEIGARIPSFLLIINFCKVVDVHPIRFVWHFASNKGAAAEDLNGLFEEVMGYLEPSTLIKYQNPKTSFLVD